MIAWATETEYHSVQPVKWIDYRHPVRISLSQEHTSVIAAWWVVQLRVAHRVVQIPSAPKAFGAEVTVRPRQGRMVIRIDAIVVVSGAKRPRPVLARGGAAVTCGGEGAGLKHPIQGVTTVSVVLMLDFGCTRPATGWCGVLLKVLYLLRAAFWDLFFLRKMSPATRKQT